MSNVNGNKQPTPSPPPREKDGFVEDDIYANIYEAIIGHQLAPGTKLGEDSLADIFGVSRTRIRRVLLRLSHDHLVRLEPNRGAFVASPSREEAKQVFAARRVIEAAIVKDVVLSITPAQISTLEQLSMAEQKACETGDRPKAIKLSGQFHLQLGEMAGNVILLQFLKDLISQTSLIIALYEIPGLPLCNQDQHTHLTRAIASKDTDVAVSAMLQHLEAVEATLNLETVLNRPAQLQDILKPRAKIP
jgi:DNA-binding GntR family transcriptional regulator